MARLPASTASGNSSDLHQRHAEAAGVATTQKLYKGVTHEFFGMGAVIDEAKEAMTFAFGELKSVFAK